MSRSLPATGWYRILSILTIISFVGYVTWVNIRTSIYGVQLLTIFFGVFALITTGYMTAALKWRTFKYLPMAEGKVLAIIPAYEETSESVKQVVRSLLHQTRLPDKIYVIDDGSSTPIEGFKDPRVTWLRQDNQGKRHAQVNALRRHSADEFDYILTVDSDSVLDPDALSHLLRSMTWKSRRGKQVMAATGMIFTRNWNENLTTRLTDINIVSACLLLASFFSWMGIQTPTSGAIALYRSHVVYDNIDPYLSSGEVGDDRWLSFYALRIGQVVRVNEAIAETALPATYMGTIKQRMRWAKSAYLGLPFVATELQRLDQLLLLLPDSVPDDLAHLDHGACLVLDQHRDSHPAVRDDLPVGRVNDDGDDLCRLPSGLPKAGSTRPGATRSGLSPVWSVPAADVLLLGALHTEGPVLGYPWGAYP